MKEFKIFLGMLALIGLSLVAKAQVTVIDSGYCGASGSNLEWKLTSDSVLTISGSGDMENYVYGTGSPPIYAPWYSSYRNRIKTVIIEDSVASIGEHAFLLCALTSVTIGKNITTIGTYAFRSCNRLHTVNYNAINCTSGNTNVYSNCNNFTTLNIGNQVKTIPDFAFSGCSSLISVTIPDSVTIIGNYAFAHCSSLVSVTIPNSVTTIGKSAFSYCKKLTSIIIPDSVTSIGEMAFYECIGLTSVTISNSVTEIEGATFFGCNRLTSITIPNNVTSIGGGAFQNCSNLDSIIIPNNVGSIGSNAFWNCSALTSVTIGGSVASIWSYAFYGCNKLIFVSIPSNVAYVDVTAFAFCDSLTSLNVDNNNYIYSSIDGIVYNKMQDTLIFCPRGKTGTVLIPNGVISIGSFAFGGCSQLTSVTIPDSVTNIGEEAFSHCIGLTSIACKAINPPVLGQWAFNYVPTHIPIYVPCGTVSEYQASYWSRFFTNFIDSCNNINEVVQNEKISVFPNPAGNQLKIVIGGEWHSPVQVEVYSIVGQNVGSYAIRPNDNIIDVSHLAKGMYFLKIGEKVVKFVKE